MRKLLMVAALALVPVVSQAQFSLGLRVGYAPAMGDAAKDPDTGEAAKLSDVVKSQVPVQLDALYKATPDIAVGAYFSYGFGNIATSDPLFACSEAGIDCSARDVRLGVQAIYSFNKVSPEFFPWAGVGLGYEWAQIKGEGGGQEATFKMSGIEFLNLQVGADYKVNESFVVGPYLMFSAGQYGDPTLESGGVSVDLQTSSATHEWFNFGIRGKFDL